MDLTGGGRYDAAAYTIKASLRRRAGASVPLAARAWARGFAVAAQYRRPIIVMARPYYKVPGLYLSCACGMQ